MILTIKTDNPIAEISLYNSGQKIGAIKWQAHRRLANTLHAEIQKVLKSNQINLQDLKGIVVYKGPGSFTGLRIGLSVANTLSYGLDIPVAGSSGDDWLQKGLSALSETKGSHPVVPDYGSPVNTTQPKK